MLGDSGYEQFQKSSAENILSTETTLYPFLPEQRKPPEQAKPAQ